MSLNIRMRDILKKILLIAMVVLFALSLSSCGSNKIEGTVIEKYYEPPSTYTTVVPMIVNGTTIVVPYPHYRSAQYVLKLSCAQNDGTDGTDAIIIVSVSPEEYDKIEVGDYYTNYKERKEEKRR